MSRAPTIALTALALIAACGGAAAPAAEPTAVEPAAVETVEQRCARILSRFGEPARAEEDDCVVALTVGESREYCRTNGRLAEFDSCFESCIESVGIQVDDYTDGDAVGNCEEPCAQTTCDPSFGKD